MALHPEVQVKAQAELDRVLGLQRVPSLADRQNLPYIEAIFKETIRLFPGAPLGSLDSRLTLDLGVATFPRRCKASDPE